MATATAAGVSTDAVILALGTQGDMGLADLLEATSEQAVAVAWAAGLIEFGRTKYVVTGNPDTAIGTHNGVAMPPPAVVIEVGLEWTGPKQRYHEPFHKLKDEVLPVCPAYQKYQLEVQTSEKNDAWEWLEAGQKAGRRATRYARRDIDRTEPESLFELRARLTDKGAAGLG